MYRFITDEQVEAAERHGLSLREVGLHFNVWERWVHKVREVFATLEDYLSYHAAKKAAEKQQRALRRALETNPLTLTRVIATAEAFGIAIDALPVGKDIRARLKAHLDAHVQSLRDLESGSSAA